MGRETSLKTRRSMATGGQSKAKGGEGRSKEQRAAQSSVHSWIHLAVLSLFIHLKQQPVGLDCVEVRLVFSFNLLIIAPPT